MWLVIRSHGSEAKADLGCGLHPTYRQGNLYEDSEEVEPIAGSETVMNNTNVVRMEAAVRRHSSGISQKLASSELITPQAESALALGPGRQIRF